MAEVRGVVFDVLEVLGVVFDVLEALILPLGEVLELVLEVAMRFSFRATGREARLGSRKVSTSRLFACDMYQKAILLLDKSIDNLRL